MATFTTHLCMAAFTIHLCRRLYECHWVHDRCSIRVHTLILNHCKMSAAVNVRHMVATHGP